MTNSTKKTVPMSDEEYYQWMIERYECRHQELISMGYRLTDFTVNSNGTHQVIESAGKIYIGKPGASGLVGVQITISQQFVYRANEREWDVIKRAISVVDNGYV